MLPKITVGSSYEARPGLPAVIAGYTYSREITSLVTLLFRDIRMKTFAEFTKHRLKMIGKTQKDLAERLGVSTAYISQICTDKKNPPDLGKLKNRELLKTWAEFLGAPEEELLNPIRYQLHQVPLRPNAKYEKMRTFLLNRLSPGSGGPREEIQLMQFHPAENAAIKGLVEVYLVLQEEPEEPGQVAGYTQVRFPRGVQKGRIQQDVHRRGTRSFFPGAIAVVVMESGQPRREFLQRLCGDTGGHA